MERVKTVFAKKVLNIGGKIAELPIIQGGMGVGISRSSLAGAVAKEGGVGIISTAQIGYDEEGFEQHEEECNLLAIKKHIQKAKEIAKGKGLIGVNVMVALKHYKEHVKAAVAAGADLIVCGAGLPLELPSLVPKESGSKIAPIVSSRRAAEILLKKWDKQYERTADLLVVEGPKAGGHLGFHEEELKDVDHIDFDEQVREIVECKKTYEEKYHVSIPVVVGGGVFNRDDIVHVMDLGADGVQIASRFVATDECDASQAYKQSYVDAKPEDIQIVKSPVGMPGRAIRNAFVKQVEAHRVPVTKCYNCLKKCNPGEVPYCITKALTNAVKGDLDHGLIFCGANVGKIKEIVPVHRLIEELVYG